MPFDREIFFAELVAAGEMDPVHLEIANAMFDEWHTRDTLDPRWLAYVMATALDDHHRVEDPDLQTGSVNLLNGMIDGLYTGFSLKQYFTNEFSAWVPARAIVDTALGDAESVATDAKIIYDALGKSSNISIPDLPDVSEFPGMPEIPPPEPPPEDAKRGKQRRDDDDAD